MRAVEFITEEIKIDHNARTKAWIEKVYAEYPQTWQNNHIMVMGGTGDDQQFAMFELVPSMSKKDAVEVKWFQAYPLRQGVGSRAMQQLQTLAQEDGIALTLYPWDKGQVSQAKLTKFYKGQGFKPTVKGAKNMMWTPEIAEADMSRRGFLKGLGAAGLAAAGGNAFAKAQRTERVIVGPGDTIYSIARNFGINPAEIYKLNKFDRNTRLEVGQQVLVPAVPSSVPSTSTHAKPATATHSTPTHAKPTTSTHSTPTGKVGNNALQEPGFIEKLQKVASSLGVSANALAGIIKHESHFKHHTPNPHSGAVGLIQFTPKTAKQLGTTTQQLAKMTATQQLDYVEKFYKSVGVKPGMDIGDLYMLTFIPTYAGVKNPNVVLGKKGGGILPGTDLSMNRIWAQNPIFSDGKSFFTIKDVKDRLEKFLA